MNPASSDGLSQLPQIRTGVANTGENLLFGILALQNNFINRTALLAAFNAWVTDKSRSLGNLLVEQGALDNECHDLLNALVSRHIKLNDNNPEQSLAALSSVNGAVESLRSIADLDLEASLRSLPSTARGNNDEIRLVPSPTSGSGVRYQRVRHHAKGGLGEVFVARDTELNREVALKEIQTDYADDPVSRTRFVVEAEVTGGLEHPGIVPVYGLGHYDNGRPFYAMRFIKGDSLKDAIDQFHKAEILGRDPGERILSLQKLLRRFLDVCDAIEYAHSRGILHRDLKPNNVMVGKYGETLVVDWGLAKSVGRSGGDEPLPEATLRPFSASGSAETLPGSVIGTPAYMSPEQAAGQLDLMGPASDVYSLGATLYALFTGKSPFAARDVNVTLRQVQRGEFPKPRTVVRWLDPALEAVCLKAMALKPDDRYRSPRALANDVERWIADEPVSVRREPYHERVRRWGRRNRTVVSTVGVALLAVLVGLSAVAAVQTRANRDLKKEQNKTAVALVAETKAKKDTQEALAQSEESRKQAEAVSTFLVESFRSPDPSVDGNKIKVVDLLDRAEKTLDEGFSGTGATRGALLDSLGRTYRGLGLYDKSVATHEKARTILETALGPDHRETLAGSENLAVALKQAGRSAEAIAMHEETLKRFESTLGPDHRESLSSRGNLANAYAAAGRTTEANRLYEETLKRSESTLGPDHPYTFSSRNNLAEWYQRTSRTTESIAMHEQTLNRRQSTLGPDHPTTLISRNNLALAYAAAGRTADAIRLDEETLKLRESKLGSEHPYTLTSRNNLARAYATVGRTADAIRLDEETLKLRESTLGPNHPDTLTSRSNLAADYADAGRMSDAIRLDEETLRLSESKLGPDHPDTLTSRNNLAIAYSVSGRTSEAVRLNEETLGLSEKKLGPDHPITLISRWSLATAYNAVGQTSKSIPLLEESRKRMTSKMGREHPNVLKLTGHLTTAYESLGRWAEAEILRRQTLAHRRKTEKPDSPLLADALAGIGANLLDQSKWSDAELVLRECVAVRAKVIPDGWSRFYAMSLLGGVLLGQGKYADAEQLVVPRYEGMKAREAKIPASGKPRLAKAAERVVRLYEAWGKPDEAAAWKVKLGLGDLPLDVFARP